MAEKFVSIPWNQLYFIRGGCGSFPPPPPTPTPITAQVEGEDPGDGSGS